MEFEDVIRNRYSTKSFSSKKIEDEKLNKLLEVVKLAPTAKNLQPQKVYVIKSKESLDKINACTPCIYSATTVLMIAFDKNVSWKNPFTNEEQGMVDATIIATHLMLECENLGLNACFVGFFDHRKVEEVFSLPEEEQVVCLMPIGYKKEEFNPLPNHYSRKDLKETVKII